MADEALAQLNAAELIHNDAERGRAREHIIRAFLTRLVPPGFAASTRFVIDSAGGESRQQDIVVFRRGYHPVFHVGSIEVFPVEAVAAVIEVKSTPDSRELRSAIENALTVKRLDRSRGGLNYRVIGGAGGNQAGPVDPEMHEHQVFSLIVAARAGVTAKTIAVTFRETLGHEPRRNWPNVVVVANEWVLAYVPPPRDDAPRSNQMIGQRLRVSYKKNPNNVEPLLDAAEQLWSFLRVTPLIDAPPSAYVRGSWWEDATFPLPGEE
jgi:hypothetical protein